MSSKKLESQLLGQLKECCKNEASYQKLEEIFEGLYSKYEKVTSQLNLLEQAIKYDYDSILITELNLEKPGPKIVYVNDAFTKMTGYTKEEVIGKTPRILQGPKTDRKVLDRLKKRLIEGQAFFGHTINYRKDGTEFVNQWDIHPLTNSKGEITHWVSYQRDITDRKQSSKLVFDSSVVEADNLYEESRKTFVDLDVQGNIISSNNSFKETLDYDADELKEVKIWDLVSSGDKEEVESLFSDFDSGNVEEKSYQWTFNTKDDELVRLQGQINSFKTNDETIIRIHFDNISMRNRIMAALKKKKENLEKILDRKDEFILRFVTNKDGEITCKYVSDAFAEITGLDPKLIFDKGVSEVLHKDDLNDTEKAMKEAFKGKETTVNCKYKTSDGEYISVVQSFKPVFEGKKTDKVESVKSVGMIELEVAK